MPDLGWMLCKFVAWSEWTDPNLVFFYWMLARLHPGGSALSACGLDGSSLVKEVHVAWVYQKPKRKDLYATNILQVSTHFRCVRVAYQQKEIMRYFACLAYLQH